MFAISVSDSTACTSCCLICSFHLLVRPHSPSYLCVRSPSPPAIQPLLLFIILIFVTFIIQQVLPGSTILNYPFPAKHTHTHVHLSLEKPPVLGQVQQDVFVFLYLLSRKETLPQRIFTCGQHRTSKRKHT